MKDRSASVMHAGSEHQLWKTVFETKFPDASPEGIYSTSSFLDFPLHTTGKIKIFTS